MSIVAKRKASRYKAADKLGIPASFVGTVVCLLTVLIFGFSVAGALGTASVGASGVAESVTDSVTANGLTSNEAGAASDSSAADTGTSATSAEVGETSSDDDVAAQSDTGDDDANATDSGSDSDDDSATDSDDYGTAMDGAVTIHLHAAVNNEWKYVGRDGTLYDSSSDEGYEPITVTKQADRAGGNRAIIPADVLETALKPFGFTADSEIKRANQPTVDWGNYLFGYCDSGSSTIYNDVTPQYVSSQGKWYVFTKGYSYIHMDTGDKSLDLYYLPANRNDGAFTTPASFFADGTTRQTDNAQVLADNSFYPVTVEDEDGNIYGADETLPTGYIMTSAGDSKKTFTIKKPTAENYKWQVVAADGKVADVTSVTDNGDGTLTYTFSSVTGPVTFRAIEYNPNVFTLTYTASMLDSDKETLGNIAASNQVITENATIDDGQTTKTVDIDTTTAGDTYTFLSPDTDIATVYWTQATTRKFIYSFMGWKIEGQDTVYAAGDTIDMSLLKSFASATGNVNIKSVWLGNDTNTSSPHIRSANFYLNLDCEILDVDGSSSSTGQANYTESIFSTRVSGTDTFGAGGFTLYPLDSSASSSEVDAKIRNATAKGEGIKPPASWTNYTQDGVTFERIPTDEEIMEQVRASDSQIKIDDVVIPKENITTSNFTVRWYVVKYDTTDGWHVDGVLVAKKSRLVVSKTFEGETDAIAQFKKLHGYESLDEYDTDSDFHINVTHEAEVDGEETTVTDYELLLVPDSSLDHNDATDRRYGYSSYDESTNTYTWVVDSRQNRDYTVKELNYYLEDTDTWNNLTWHEVHNSSSDYNTNGWKEYNTVAGASVKVVAAAYPDDVPDSALPTVGFRNVYVHKGTLAIFKNDYITDAAMAGVKFSVTQQDSEAVSSLYQKTGTNEYTTDTTVVDQSSGEYTKVDDGKATTDVNGVFYLSLAAPSSQSDKSATYVLTEDKTTAEGYDGADTIAFTMSYNSGIVGDVITSGGSTAVDPWAKAGDNSFILNIYNRSAEYTSVTAKKQWADGTTDKKPVTVQLWRSYGPVTEIVPEQGAGANSTLADVAGNKASNEVQLSATNNWTFSWGNLPLFINNQPVTYLLRETWIGDPQDSSSVAYDPSADPNDGFLDYAVTTEAARYVDGDLPGVTVDNPRSAYTHDTSSWTDDSGATIYASHVLLMVNNAEVKGVISFTKADREGQDSRPLSGATFELYSDAACTKVLDTKTTGEDGIVTFSKQPAGTYYIKETQAPAGYSFDAAAVYQAVVSNGTPAITKVGDAKQTSVTIITNKFGAGLTIKKIGGGDIATSAGIAGAEFMLAKENGSGDWATAQRLTTNANGELTFTGLDQGTYTLTETKVAPGYEVTGDILLTFTVETEDGKTVFKFNNDDFDKDTEAGFVSYESQSTDSNIAYKLTVRNKALYDLPTTGRVGLLPITLAGVALMCVAVWFWFARSGDATSSAGGNAGSGRRGGGRHA